MSLTIRVVKKQLHKSVCGGPTHQSSQQTSLKNYLVCGLAADRVDPHRPLLSIGSTLDCSAQLFLSAGLMSVNHLAV